MKERPIIFSGAMVRAILQGRKTQTRRVIKNAPNGAHSYVLGVHHGVWGILDAPSAFRARCPYGQPGDRLWVREAFQCEDTSDYAGEPGILEPLGPSRPLESGGMLIPRYRASEPDTALMIAPTESDPIGMRWKPSIHMPRWASRITLYVTGVRVERLQDISEADARAEGCEASKFPGPWWQGYIRDPDGELRHQQATGVEPPEWMIEPKRMRDMSHCDISARDAFRMLWFDIHSAGSWNANPWVWAVEFRHMQNRSQQP